MFETAADEALFRFVAKPGIEPGLRDVVERAARTRHVTAVEALCDGGWIDEDAPVALFQHQLRLPRVALGDHPALGPGIDRELLRRRLAVPTAVDDRRLLLAMANPLDYEVIERIRFASGRRVVPAVAPLSEIRAQRIEVAIRSEACAACVVDQGPAWRWPRPSARTPDIERFAGESVSPEARAFLIRSAVDEASFKRRDDCNLLWLVTRRAEPTAPGGFHAELPSIATH
jgi:hypothetical protein